MLEYLTSRPDVKILGSPGSDPAIRVATISFLVTGPDGETKSSREIVEAVDAASEGEVGIRWGMFYSNRLVENVLGVKGGDGVVRVSLVHYNSCKCSSTFDECCRFLLFDDLGACNSSPFKNE